jgi:hypothetical protein
MKMQHSAYIELNEDLVSQYYKGNDYKMYKGYRLLAIDGSRIQLPRSKEIIDAYGLLGAKEKPVPMATISTAYDVLNNITVNTYLERGDAAERTLFERHLEAIKQKTPGLRDIIIADRGYPSLYLFVKMLENGYNFVIRCSEKGFINEIKEFSKTSINDSIIEIGLDQGPRRNISTDRLIEKPEKLILRILKVEIGEGKTEYLITSLRDKKEFSIDELKKIYHLRWSIETYFNLQKNVFELENLSGKTPETIKQDYYARVLSSNLSSLLIEEAQEEIDIDDEDKPEGARRKINRSVAIGLLKDHVIDLLLLQKEDRTYKYRKLVSVIKKHTIPIIKNRSFPRIFKRYTNCFRKKRKII